MDLDDVNHGTNVNGKTTVMNTPKHRSSKDLLLPSTAVDLDDSDIMSYGSVELAACWEGVVDDDYNDFRGTNTAES